MRNKIILWVCYAVTAILSTIIYFLGHYGRLNATDGSGHVFGYGSAFYAILIMSFITGLILGSQNINLKCLNFLIHLVIALSGLRLGCWIYKCE